MSFNSAARVVFDFERGAARWVIAPDRTVEAAVRFNIGLKFIVNRHCRRPKLTWKPTDLQRSFDCHQPAAPIARNISGVENQRSGVGVFKRFIHGEVQSYSYLAPFQAARAGFRSNADRRLSIASSLSHGLSGGI
jgi:hypothetical protein